MDTFYLGTGSALVMAGGITGSPVRRSRSRGPSTVVEEVSRQRRARSKSRPRALYAPESEVVRVNGKNNQRSVLISFNLIPNLYIYINKDFLS